MATTEQATSTTPLAYAQRGFRVIPLYAVDISGNCTCPRAAECGSPGKHPVAKNWQNAARTSEQFLETMFEGRNVGIATGKDSDIFVVDIDPGSGGFESAKQWAIEYGWNSSETLRVKTGSGGYHLYYRLPDFEVRNSASKLAPGIDIRGEGGQVVAPPSVSSKGPYRVVGNAPIAEAPAWLLEKLRPEAKPRPERTTAPRDLEDLPSGESGRLRGYSEGAVKHEVDRLLRLGQAKVPQGQTYLGDAWNQTTYEVACNLLQLKNAQWSSLRSEEEVYKLVLENAPRDDGFTDEDIVRTIDSARNKIGDKETPMPAELTSFMFPDGKPPETEDVVEVREVSARSINGIPLVDGVLTPDLGMTTAAAELGGDYSAQMVELKLEDVDIDPHDIVAPLESGPAADLGPAEAWVTKWIRSGSPELFWEAVGCLLAGVDDLEVDITIKGAGPLLRMLTGLARPSLGKDSSVLHWGPKHLPVQGGKIFIAFAPEGAAIDIVEHRAAFMQRAKRAYAAVRARGSFSIPAAHEIVDTNDTRTGTVHSRLTGISSTEREGVEHG